MIIAIFENAEHPADAGAGARSQHHLRLYQGQHLVLLARLLPLHLPLVIHTRLLLLPQSAEGLQGLLHHPTPVKYARPHTDCNMSPSAEYPFPPLFVNDKIYLNRYTE